MKNAKSICIVLILLAVGWILVATISAQEATSVSMTGTYVTPTNRLPVSADPGFATMTSTLVSLTSHVPQSLSSIASYTVSDTLLIEASGTVRWGPIGVSSGTLLGLHNLNSGDSYSYKYNGMELQIMADTTANSQAIFSVFEAQ